MKKALTIEAQHHVPMAYEALQLPPREFEVWMASSEARLRAIRLARRIIADPVQWIETQADMAALRVHGRFDRIDRDNGGGR